MARRRRTAVLISGGGTNLQALLDATADPAASAEVVLVVSNRGDAYGLARAQARGIAAVTVDHREFKGREPFEAAVDARLRDAGVELVCLAGFMRVLTAGFVEAWRDRLLNVHPSLLPALPGLDTHARVLAMGLPVAGCTVHMVRPEVDAGPVLTQGVVPVLPSDTPETLAARVLELEHVIYPLALELVAAGRLVVDGERAAARDAVTAAARLKVHPELLGRA